MSQSDKPKRPSRGKAARAASTATTSSADDRRAKAARIQDKQKAKEKGRGLLVVALSGLVAVAIIGAAAYGPLSGWWKGRELADVPITEIGAAASVCQDITTKPADGNQDHVEPGTPLSFQDAPPAFGTHYSVWEGLERPFYTVADRPDIGRLVHNLEHGFTILWYDDTAAADDAMMTDIKALAKKFTGSDDLRRLKFKAAPWTKDDGDAFPDGQHIAFTHWSVGGAGNTAADEQLGVWQYCSEPSGAALDSFMQEYDYLDSPEPGAV